MSHEQKIEKRATEMLANPDDLMTILNQINTEPRYRRYLHQILGDAREVYGTLDQIFRQAATEAATTELEFSRWLEAEDARFERDLEIALASRYEWVNTREAA